MRLFHSLSLLLAGVAATLPALTVSAQQATAPHLSGRFSGGLQLQLSEPRGEFGRNTDNGYGIGGYAVARLDESSVLNWRADVSLLSYANSTRRLPLAGTGGLIQLNLRTSSNIVSVVTGPQLLGPTGVFIPYAALLGGFSVFWTSSSIEGTNNIDGPFATSTNSNDAVWAYGASTGAYIRIRNGQRPIRLDLGARFLRHDDVRYLNDERVRDAFENDQTPVPVRGRADFITYFLGVNIILN